jgi:hypothetical protein
MFDSGVKTVNILMFVAQPYGMALNLFGVDELSPHEGIECIDSHQFNNHPPPSQAPRTH